ncbi:MAG TPA: hypothetical protein PKD59_10490 [Miltoncostaeaceae bacterium]|nr:hypothetical protein [Miltoncostaeaceae bacterium]
MAKGTGNSSTSSLREEDRELIRQMVADSRRAQGLPEEVTDRTVIAKLVRLMERPA